MSPAPPAGQAHRPDKIAATLSLSRETCRWLFLQSSTAPRATLAQRLLYRWQAYWFDRNLALAKSLSPGPANLRDDPVFVLGLWRSGTTLLHELLAALPGMQTPTTWQCMNPSLCGLIPPPRGGAAIRRPMDDVAVSPDSPQEDEFALLALGVPSVYRAFLDPRRLTALEVCLDQDYWLGAQSEGWLEIWCEFLARACVQGSGPLLLKSPNHIYRLEAIARRFPRARHVWVLRDPHETLFSNRRMWLAMFQRYALWPWDEEALDAFLAQAFLAAAKSLDRASEVAGPARICAIAYSQLIQSPLETIEQVNARLSLGEWAGAANAIRTRIAASTAREPARYAAATIPAPLSGPLEELRAAQARALAVYGL